MTLRSQIEARGRGLSLRSIGCTFALSVTTAPLQLQLPTVALYKCYVVTFTFYLYFNILTC